MKQVSFSIVSFLVLISLAVGVVILILVVAKPAKTMVKLRDQERLSDMTKLETALELYVADGKNFDNLITGEVYISTSGSNDTRGQGWLPLDFSLTSGDPLKALPVDPLNNSAYNYEIGINAVNKTFEIDCRFEDLANAPKMANDQGNNPNVYEVGNDLTILK